MIRHISIRVRGNSISSACRAGREELPVAFRSPSRRRGIAVKGFYDFGTLDPHGVKRNAFIQKRIEIKYFFSEIPADKQEAFLCRRSRFLCRFIQQDVLIRDRAASVGIELHTHSVPPLGGERYVRSQSEFCAGLINAAVIVGAPAGKAFPKRDFKGSRAFGKRIFRKNFFRYAFAADLTGLQRDVINLADALLFGKKRFGDCRVVRQSRKPANRTGTAIGKHRILVDIEVSFIVHPARIAAAGCSTESPIGGLIVSTYIQALAFGIIAER